MTELSKEKLQQLIEEMTDRVIKVAELVDQVFPDKKAGIGIKECADQLQTYMNTFAAQTQDDIPMSELVALAKKECADSFKLLRTLKEEEDVSRFRVVSHHNRELFKLLVSEETCVKGAYNGSE